ncbi:Hsp20/alpha crystallin family protein [Candidatus Parcubacteria bacterium]|nr:Hsp20/alpha crystallin family protein [Candidatus Parcubacteria bacterium]
MGFLKKSKKNKGKEISIKELDLDLEEEKEKESEEKWFKKEGQLVVDVFQTDSEIVIQSPVAGVKPEDLDISIENDIITIRGERKKPGGSDAGGPKYLYQECWWGAFSRKIVLPEEVNPEEISASMKKGILTIKLPIIHREKERKISVKQ